VLEANPRASRTVPIVSKVCSISMARLATQVMLGKKLGELCLQQRIISHYGVKEAVFPFNMFPEVDPVLGPEMRSTGEVLGMSHSYGRAFFKAQEATQVTLPLKGTVLFTIADRDKTAALEPVRLFRDLGFRILTTKGTYAFLRQKGIETEPVQKLGFGRPNLVDAIKNNEIQLLVNTPSGRQRGGPQSRHQAQDSLYHHYRRRHCRGQGHRRPSGGRAQGTAAAGVPHQQPTVFSGRGLGLEWGREKNRCRLKT
jgi:carbamoyl-phosphate synthase large subunit